MSLKITRPERDVALCLDAALQVEWEAAEAALAEARNAPAPTMLAEKPAQVVAAERVRDVESRMAESVVVFRLRAMRRADWAAAIARHPAGEDATDKAFGADRAGFFAEAIPASIVAVSRAGEPVEFDTGSEWESLADEMTDRQYSQFADTVFVLNRGEVSVPFSRAASRLTRA